jgi:hypothetical protein
LPLKDCETHRGYEWEEYVLRILEDAGYRVERQTTKAPFDLLVAEKVRVNVKSARWNSYGPSKGFFFGLSDTWKSCDLFALVKDQKNAEVLWVPSERLAQQTLTLTPVHSINQYMYIEIIKDFLP